MAREALIDFSRFVRLIEFIMHMIFSILYEEYDM